MAEQSAADGDAEGFREAAAILADRDPVLRRLVAEAGSPRLRPRADGHFGALVARSSTSSWRVRRRRRFTAA